MAPAGLDLRASEPLLIYCDPPQECRPADFYAGLRALT